MSYVKQHIARVHQMPLHCQICNEVFQTEDQLREHVPSTSYEPQPYTPPDAVMEEQTIQLRSRADHKKTTEDQWYEVFDILFPGRQRPTSVYLEPDSQDLDEFVHFLTSDGTGIILNRLTPLIDGYSSNSFPGLLSALNGALQEVYGQWRWRKHVEGRSSIAPEVTPARAPQDGLERAGATDDRASDLIILKPLLNRYDVPTQRACDANRESG